MLYMKQGEGGNHDLHDWHRGVAAAASKHFDPGQSGARPALHDGPNYLPHTERNEHV